MYYVLSVELVIWIIVEMSMVVLDLGNIDDLF